MARKPRHEIITVDRQVGPMRPVGARARIGQTRTLYDISVPDHATVGNYRRWLKDIDVDEILALQECLNELLP